jgi:GGDEF domain-containing protein
MRRLQLSCAVFFCWLFVLYNIERLHPPIDIASFVHVLVAVVAALAILVPAWSRLPNAWVTVLIVTMVLLLKFWLGYEIGGAALPFTVTEASVALVTANLAHRLGQSLEEHRQAVVRTLVGHLHDPSRPFEDAFRDMYREVRRARSSRRPLTIVAISPTKDCLNATLDRVTKEAQQATVRRYLRTKLGELLSHGTKSTDLIFLGNEHFVMLLPETGRHTANRFIKKLRSRARTALGIDLAIGASVFPEDDVTFVKLIERAKARMDRGATADPTQADSRDLERGAAPTGSAAAAGESVTERVVPTSPSQAMPR